MRKSKWVVASVAVVGLVGSLVVMTAEGRGRTAPRARSDACDDAANALLNAAKHQAEADYWIHLANCLNDPNADPKTCQDDAATERDDAIAFAKEQRDARLFVCDELGGGPYDPVIDPSEFSPNITNRFSPFIPGITMIYEKKGADGDEIVQVRPLKDVVDIAGFKCRVVRDVSHLDGALLEDTTDYYAQRTDGAVWYFGEVSQGYVDGFLDSLDGSWRTGRDHAKPGIVMEGAPAIGDLYRQEFQPNEAEDLARVISLDETVTVPVGTFKHCLQTEERSPLEPDQVEWKYYALDVGLVLTIDVNTGEREELIKIKN